MKCLRCSSDSGALLNVNAANSLVEAVSSSARWENDMEKTCIRVDTTTGSYCFAKRGGPLAMQEGF
jgi:hypothetical protein